MRGVRCSARCGARCGERCGAVRYVVRYVVRRAVLGAARGPLHAENHALGCRPHVRRPAPAPAAATPPSAGLKSSPIYLYNGVAMAVSFLILRIIGMGSLGAKLFEPCPEHYLYPTPLPYP